MANADQPSDAGYQVVDEFSIVNEFAGVRIRKVRSRVGERLEIHSARHNRTIRLDATMLEAISWQSSAALSKFIEEMPQTHPE
jgi:hypothetical protein